jgi:hypothetical protein
MVRNLSSELRSKNRGMTELRTSVRFVSVICMVLMFAISGCATVPARSVASFDDTAKTPAVNKKMALEIDSGAIIVRAKYVSKFELKKKEAVRKNNKDSVVAFAGTAGALTAYTVLGSLNGRKPNPAASFCIVGATAYVSAAISGLIYDLFTKNN